MKQFIGVVALLLPVLSSSYYVRIGILSHDMDPETTKKIWSLAQNYSTMMSLEPVVEMAQWRDIESAAKFSRSICSLVTKGVDALVYLGSPRYNSIVSSYAVNTDVPFLSGGRSDPDVENFECSMLPDTTEAAADIIIRYGWEQITFFYDSDNGPHHLQKMLDSLLSVELVPRIDGFWKVDSMRDASYYLRKLPTLVRRHFVLATSEEFADALVNAVDRSDIMLLTPVGTVKNTSHRRGNTLIKFSVVDAEDSRLKVLENRLKTLSTIFIARRKARKDIPDSAIWHYVSSSILNTMFNTIAREKPSLLIARKVEGCFNVSKELIRHSVDANYFLESVHVEHGLMGNVLFNGRCMRQDFKLNVMQTSSYGEFEKIATWSDSYGLHPIRDVVTPPSSPTYAAYKSEQPIRVTGILMKPFLQQAENGTLYGYARDFLDELSKEIKMKYDLKLVKDSRYGVMVDGKWAGMIGELLSGEADIAVADLTKSLERMEVIDFSKNIMSTGLNILMKKPQSGMESVMFSPFTFLTIWSPDTWILITIMVAIYSAGSYGISRFIGYPDRVRALESKGTDNLSPCGGVWFTVGSLFCRDTGIYPRYITHRLWALLWWLCCIFIGMLYISMLTNALIKVRTSVTVTHTRKTSHELLKEYVDTGYPVIGTLMSGSTAAIFKNSDIGLYQQFANLMRANPDSLVLSYAEGVERVRKSNGKYAFVMESASSELTVNTEPCDTIVTSGYLFTRPFAVAFPKNSSLKEIIDHGVLSLIESGKLRQLYEKWWHGQGSTCEDPELNILPKVYNTAMTLYEVSGIFYLFILFSLLSAAAAVVEYYIRTRRIIVR